MRCHRSLASVVALATCTFALAASAQQPDKPSDHSAAAAPGKSDQGKKPDAKKAGDKKADEKKADAKKAGDKKPAEAKAGEKKPAEAKAGEKKPAEAKAGEKKPAEQNAQKPAGQGEANSGQSQAGSAGSMPAAPGTGTGAAAAPAAQPAAPAAQPAAPAAQPAAPAAPATAPVAAPPAAAAPPPAAAPPAQPAPAYAPTAPASAAPTNDQGAGAGTAKAKRPPETTLGVELDVGTNARLDGATPGYASHESVNLAYGGGVWFAPRRLYSLGVSFQRAGIGAEASSPIGNSISVTRDLNTLWLGGRAYPLRSDKIGLYVQLNLGASWQHLQASGTTVTTDQMVATAHPFECSASQGPGFALGGGVGADVDLDNHLAFLASAGFSAHRLSSNASDLGGCAPGSGSVTNFAAKIGFMYRFDLGGSSNEATASSKHVVGRF